MPLLNTFLIGCDPEFVVIKPVKELINLESRLPQVGTFGYDHHGKVAELRPRPSKDVLAVLYRLQTLIKTASVAKTIRQYHWQAGGWYENELVKVPLGGHVHVDIPFGSERCDIVVLAMDQITQCLEEADILPHVECMARRKTEFGKLANIREHAGHLEYRTLPSWLYSPKVALLCLTAIKLAATVPKDTYRTFVSGGRGSGKLETWFGAYAARDSNAAMAAQFVREAQGQDPDADIKKTWETILT